MDDDGRGGLGRVLRVVLQRTRSLCLSHHTTRCHLRLRTPSYDMSQRRGLIDIPQTPARQLEEHWDTVCSVRVGVQFRQPEACRSLYFGG